MVFPMLVESARARFRSAKPGCPVAALQCAGHLIVLLLVCQIYTHRPVPDEPTRLVSASSDTAARPNTSKATSMAWREALCCGPNSLYIFLKSHDYQVDYMRIREDVPLTDRGCSFADLASAAEDAGASVAVVKTDLTRIREASLPAIVLLDSTEHDFGHFTVLVEADSEGVMLLDPLTTLTTRIPNADFQRVWSSYALVLVNPSRDTVTLIIVACSLGLVAISFYWFVRCSRKDSLRGRIVQGAQ